MATKSSAKSDHSRKKNYLPLFLQSGIHNRRFSEHDDKNISNFRRVLPQLLAFSAQNLLQFGYGLTQGFPTIAIPAIIKSAEQGDPYGSKITLNKEQVSWLTSINLICMPLGCIFSGMLAQYLGKRLAMQFVNLPMLAAWLLFYFASCTEHMYVALCFVGVGGGLMEAPVITYLAEITDPKYRGVFSALATTCVSFGVLIQFMFGSVMHWRTAALVSATIPIISMITLRFVPESPVWLIREGRLLDAVHSLQWLRGWVPEHKVEEEFKQLYDELIKNKPEENSAPIKTGRFLHRKMHMWRKRTFVIPFVLVLFTFFICHFSGKTPLRTYAVQIFDTLKAPIHKNHATILLGISEMIATLLGALLIQSTGKRPLMLTSMLGTGTCILGIAIYTKLFRIYDLTGFAMYHDTVNASRTASGAAIAGPQLATFEQTQIYSWLVWLPLILVLLSAFFANLAIRMIPWVLIGEVFPADIRNSASGFAGGIGYIFGFLANKLFLLMLKLLTLPGTFILYASVSLMGIVILHFTLPETEGRTLGEIEAHFSKKTNVNLFRKQTVNSVHKEGLRNVT